MPCPLRECKRGGEASRGVERPRGKKRKPRRPRGEEPRTAESNAVGNGDEGDGTAEKLEESAENDPAAMGTELDAAPTPLPLQPSVPASERGAVSREDV